jgi:protein SCO1/2
MSEMNTTRHWLRGLAAVLVLSLLSACSDSGMGERVLAARPPGGDFVLQSAAGPLDTKALRGKVLLIYFGYVNCPDVCPGLDRRRRRRRSTRCRPAEREKTRMIMVSVDPERDTPAKLKDLRRLFPSGRCSAPSARRPKPPQWRSQFGVGYVRQPTRPDGSYAVDHSSPDLSWSIADGKLMDLLPLGVPTDQVVAAVRKLL